MNAMPRRPEAKAFTATELLRDAPALAAMAGLRYTGDGERGITRRRAGKGFLFLDAAGKILRDPKILQWIRHLAIPPAWVRSGSVPIAKATSRPLAAMPVAASNTATIPGGASGGTRRNTTVSRTSAWSCRRSGRRWRATWR